METIALILTGAILMACVLAGVQIYRTDRMRQSGRLDRLERLAEGVALKDAGAQHEPIRLIYALDRDTILNLYHQVVSARGAPVGNDSEEGVESGTSAGVPFWPFTSASGRSSAPAQWASFGPEREPARAVRAVEKKLQESHTIRSIDLTASVDERPLNLLLNTLEHRASEMGMQIPAEMKSALHHAWESRNQELTDDTLANLTGFVKLRADFAISASDSGDLLLKARSTGEQNSSKLSALCRQEHILNTARTVLIPGETVRANCFGIVTRWDEECETLSLLPLAIYS